MSLFKSDSAWALTDITSGNIAMPNLMHLRQVVLKKKISIFSCVFLWFKPRGQTQYLKSVTLTLGQQQYLYDVN